MDHAEDVERLFSWLSAPMVHYREFAPKVDVAEAVAAWPLAHRAAAESGMNVGSVVPHGGAAAHERVARDQMGLPAIVAQALHENPPPGTVRPNLAPPVVEPPRPTTDSLVAALGQRVHATNLERAEGIHAAVPTEPLPPPPAPPPPPVPPPPPLIQRATTEPPAEPVMAGFEEPALIAPPLQSQPSSLPPLIQEQHRRGRQEPDLPSRALDPLPDGDRGLFRGESRARDERAANQVTDRQDRSLGAVFDRLSGGRERLPDPRNRSRTTPGLGSIFNRPR